MIDFNGPADKSVMPRRARHITPGVHRMLDRLTDTPVAVFDAAWHQLLASPLYTALMGEWNATTSTQSGATSSTRTAVYATPGIPWRAPGGAGRRLAPNYQPLPDDPTLRPSSPNYAATAPISTTCGNQRAVGQHQAAPKTIDYPHAGALSLDRDALSVTGSDLRIMVYTA
jgi:hypothetical protein